MTLAASARVRTSSLLSAFSKRPLVYFKQASNLDETTSNFVSIQLVNRTAWLHHL